MKSVNSLMHLHCKCYSRGHGNTPVLVLLHGFLGDTNEWQEIAKNLPKHIPCYAIDLPGHGLSANISPVDTTVSTPPSFSNIAFIDTAKLIKKTLAAHNIHSCFLLGYSLGGRIALSYAQQFPDSIEGLILESCHFGLIEQDDKQKRLSNDKLWAEKFIQLPIQDVLALWYQQPVFSSLTDIQKNHLIEKRKNTNVNTIATMLVATSLANQSYVPIGFNQPYYPCFYLYGKNDKKYQQIALSRQEELLKFTPYMTDKNKTKTFISMAFNDAGHNVHFEQPLKYIQQINNIYQQYQAHHSNDEILIDK